MEKFKVQVEETKTYWERMRRSFVWPIVFVVFQLLLVLPIAYSHSLRPLETLIVFIVFCIFILVIAGFRSDTICSTYITLIEINENTVHIVFMERNKKYEIRDTLDKFSFELKNVLRHGGYIKIAHKNHSLNQYCFWNWKNENAFFNLWDYLKKRSLLNTGWFS